MTPRVMIVEDNPDIRAALGELLGAQGLDVTLADNGRDALDLLSGEPEPAWIVLDLVMPVMGGREFLQVLDAAGPHPPVTVLTALSYDAETRGIEERYGCRVLSKSTDIAVLVELARTFVGTAH
ncbi:response regulator [Lysobacter claricitrinus]|uniref:response regulator n=1 Tax=Lysobacter claricitrinus TaxID=3367728 RepID=UPI0037DA8466